MEELKKIVLSFLVALLPIKTFATIDLKKDSIIKINTIINEVKKYSTPALKLQSIINQLADSPFLKAQGPNNPLYRFDGFDCQTFIQSTLALLHSDSQAAFETNYIKIAYGALAESYGHNAQFANKNHFVETDLNPINQKNGFLQDVTSAGPLKNYAKQIKVQIDRQNWLAFQHKRTKYPIKNVSISYLPKELFVTTTAEGFYRPNKEFFKKIKTPVLIELVNDPKKWRWNGKTIKQHIGTDLAVSHLGILYHQRFKKNAIIYHRIICGLNPSWHKTCVTIPVKCRKTYCNELMLAHATQEYPNGFYWYRKGNQFVCTSKLPPPGKRYTQCNRVEKLPLYAYLTNYHYGSYWNMSNGALLGIHLEALR